MQIGYVYTQTDLEEIIDSGSTISLFKRNEVVDNIIEVEIKLLMETNGGNKRVTHVADKPNCGELWFDTDTIANIHGLANTVRNSENVTMDTRVHNGSMVHRKE